MALHLQPARGQTSAPGGSDPLKQRLTREGRVATGQSCTRLDSPPKEVCHLPEMASRLATQRALQPHFHIQYGPLLLPSGIRRQRLKAPLVRRRNERQLLSWPDFTSREKPGPGASPCSPSLFSSPPPSPFCPVPSGSPGAGDDGREAPERGLPELGEGCVCGILSQDTRQSAN